MFTQKELEYIDEQILARIGTVSDDRIPDVVPVGYDFDGTSFFVGGRNNKNTLKYQNVARGNTDVTMVIDSLESVRPWVVKGLKIYGKAEIVDYDGYAGPGKYIRVKPTRKRSWGINANS